MEQPSRRGFLKTAAMTIALAPLIARAAGKGHSKTSKADAGKDQSKAGNDPKLEMLKEDDPQAKALGYKTDASKVDTKAYPKRASAEAKKEQFCRTCQLYTKVSGEGASEVGACALFSAPTKRHVHGAGWCNSWLKKA